MVLFPKSSGLLDLPSRRFKTFSRTYSYHDKLVTYPRWEKVRLCTWQNATKSITTLPHKAQKKTQHLIESQGMLGTCDLWLFRVFNKQRVSKARSKKQISITTFTNLKQNLKQVVTIMLSYIELQKITKPPSWHVLHPSMSLKHARL